MPGGTIWVNAHTYEEMERVRKSLGGATTTWSRVCDTLIACYDDQSPTPEEQKAADIEYAFRLLRSHGLPGEDDAADLRYEASILEAKIRRLIYRDPIVEVIQ
jgi:hypothetical protein